MEQLLAPDCPVRQQPVERGDAVRRQRVRRERRRAYRPGETNIPVSEVPSRRASVNGSPSVHQRHAEIGKLFEESKLGSESTSMRMFFAYSMVLSSRLAAN